jgi:hypothetical protein
MAVVSSMVMIRSLKPNVSFEEACRQFSGGSLLGYARQAAFGPLHSMAKFYIPFRLFKVQVLNRGKTQIYWLGLDLVTGSLNCYAFAQPPDGEEFISLETRNCIPASVPDAAANSLMIAKVRRLVFSSGFFGVRNLRISAQAVPEEIHVPYWAGFRGAGMQVHVAVMDAVRRRMEGVKVRQLLRTWLLQSSRQASIGQASMKTEASPAGG